MDLAPFRRGDEAEACPGMSGASSGAGGVTDGVGEGCDVQLGVMVTRDVTIHHESGGYSQDARNIQLSQDHIRGGLPAETNVLCGTGTVVIYVSVIHSVIHFFAYHF